MWVVKKRVARISEMWFPALQDLGANLLTGEHVFVQGGSPYWRPIIFTKFQYFVVSLSLDITEMLSWTFDRGTSVSAWRHIVIIIIIIITLTIIISIVTITKRCMLQRLLFLKILLVDSLIHH